MKYLPVAERSLIITRLLLTRLAFPKTLLFTGRRGEAVRGSRSLSGKLIGTAARNEAPRLVKAIVAGLVEALRNEKYRKIPNIESSTGNESIRPVCMDLTWIRTDRDPVSLGQRRVD